MAAIARREAQALAQDLMLQDIIITCEDRSLLEDIKQGTGGLHAMIVQEIKANVRLFQSCIFTFVKRTSSSEVVKVGKFSFSLDLGRHVWLLAPHDPVCIPSVLNLVE